MVLVGNLIAKRVKCRLCGEESRLVSQSLGVCGHCLRAHPNEALPLAMVAHQRARQGFGLPGQPPKEAEGARCTFCGNECRFAAGEKGYCGLRQNEGGRLRHTAGVAQGLLETYYDPLPTNCCAAWFCPAAPPGHNLAVFCYGCNFDCLFCQNAAHKALARGELVSTQRFVSWVRPWVECICFFGGSPEPQLPFALKAAQAAVEANRGRTLRICWEWNGCGHPKLVRKAAQLSLETGGIVKFDLKARSPELALALSGVPNQRAFDNFDMIVKEFYNERHEPPLLTATTLLVPGYVDAQEVEAIAHFIAEHHPSIPYGLLVFHPAFAMGDLPVTPVSQVIECYRAAKRHLERVHIGNLNLIGFSTLAELTRRF